MQGSLGLGPHGDTDNRQLRVNAPEIEGTVVDLNNPVDWLRPAVQVHVGKLLTHRYKHTLSLLTFLQDKSPAAALKPNQMQLPEDADLLLKGRVRIVKSEALYPDSLHL